MTVASIREKDDPIREARIEFRESEHYLISVRRIHDDVELQLRAAEPFSQRHSCTLQKFNDRDSLIGDACAPVVGNRNMLARQHLKISQPHDQQVVDLPGDAQCRV
jgi:hypothetical protein